MFTQIKDFVSERREVLASRAEKFREGPVESMRDVAMTSAERIKAFKEPVRAMAHSTARIVTVSQNAVQGLIELQTEVVTSALTAAAMRLEHAARADSVVDLVRDQAELLRATRERIAGEATRAVEIFRVAGRDARKVGSQLYTKVLEKAEVESSKGKATRARKGKRAVRKTAARTRKAAA
jgi:hypothetical protein